VADACVVGVPSAEWGQAVAAQVVVRPQQALSAPDLLAYARTQLAGYKLPRRLQFVAQLPLTASGKVHRKAVAAALVAADDAAHA
jgi:acyl-CoA synthetase (AMP-forming)/AMP-acid ligase II